MCEALPWPAVPCVAVAEFAFNHATSPCRSCAGTAFLATINCGLVAIIATGSVSAPMADADGVAVRRRARDLADANGAGSAGHVLHHDDLPDRCTHALGHNARN